MSELSTKELKQRLHEAWQRKDLYARTMRDIYDYIMPYRQAGQWARGEGKQRTDLIFDSTAVKAGFRFAGRLLNDLTPPFRPFFALEAGPLVPDDDNKKKLNEELQRIGGVINGVLSNGSWPQRAHEMFYDLFAGTAAMLINPGDDADIVRFRTVPMAEVAIDEGPWGDVWHVYWKREWRARELPELWPQGEFPQAIRDCIRDKPDEKIEVCQYTYYDPRERRWCLRVLTTNRGEDAVIWAEEFRASPWLTPRFFVVPGEAYGRGPAHLALASVKTLNKARELALTAAAFATLGLWTRRNDGVFNPDTARFEPLTFWQVGSNGGPLGPTIQRLPVPQDFDVSSIIIADEREQAKQALFDDTLPPDDVAVRSATEIAGRMRRDAIDFAGVNGRLTIEIVVKLVQRLIDILEGKGVLGTNLKVDQLLTQVRVVAPIAVAQQADKVKGAVDWLQMMTMLFGPQYAMMVANVEKLGPRLGRWLGNDEDLIRSEAEMKQLGQLAAQAAAAQAQASAPPAKPPGPQDYVNGGAP